MVDSTSGDSLDSLGTLWRLSGSLQALWRRSEDSLGTLWRLCGDFLEMLRRLCESLQPLSGDSLEIFGLETLCRLFGNSLETLWRLSGDSLETLWRPSGDSLETLWVSAGCDSLSGGSVETL